MYLATNEPLRANEDHIDIQCCKEQVKNTLYVSVANKKKENHFLLSITKSCSCVLILFWPKILKTKVISSSIKSISLVPGR